MQHKNYLDHVYGVTDDTGNLLELYRYTAFGRVETYSPTGQQLAASAIDNPVRWNSRRYDEATQLHYYKYRHYSPKLGRWLGRDPVEEDGGINLYAFVVDDPINQWDKLGEDFGWDWRFPLCFNKDKKDCFKVYNDCLVRGFTGCAGLCGYLTKKGGKPVYTACLGSCFLIYRQTCMEVKQDCDEVNRKNGF